MHRKNVQFSLTMILSISLGLVSSDGGTPTGTPTGTPNGTPTGTPNPSNHPSSGGGGGGGGGSSGEGLTVVVSYEAFNCASLNFFKNQLTSSLFDEFSQCNIDWKIYPCSTSKMVMGKLQCWQGEDECKIDRVYACATKLNEGDMKAVGKFAICLMNADSAECSAENCATQAGFNNWNSIKSCSTTDQADKDCQSYWSKANDVWQMTNLPSVMVPPKYVQKDADAAKKDFKGFLCEKLKEKQMSCSACPSSGGTNPPTGTNPPSHPPSGTPP